MDQHADLWSRFLAFLTYLISGSLAIGDFMDWLNNYAGAVGAILAGMTFLVNWVYQHRKDIRDRKERIEQLKKAYQWPCE